MVTRRRPAAAKSAPTVERLVADALDALERERKARAAALARLAARAPAPKAGARRAGTAPAAASALAKPGPARASAGTLVAEGDSWFDYPFFDVLKALELDHGYDIESVARRGDTVEGMAYGGAQLSAFASRLDKVLRRGESVRGVLLSGGGNDIAGAEFAMLLDHAASRSRGLNSRIVEAVIDERLFEAFVVLVETVTRVCAAVRPVGAPRLPIVLHGYDYPVADGRGFAGGWWVLPGPWLAPGLHQKGYAPLTDGRGLLVELIDRFNAMLARLAAMPEFAHLRHVDLRGSLPAERHREWWADELHPSRKGFRKVASAFADALRD